MAAIEAGNDVGSVVDQGPELLLAQLQRYFGSTTLDRRREDIGDRLHEVHVLLAETPPAARVDAKDAERLVLAGNDHAQAAGEAELDQARRVAEAHLGFEVTRDDRAAGLQRGRGLRVDQVALGVVGPAYAGASTQRSAGRLDLQDRGVLDGEGLGHEGDGSIQQWTRVASEQRTVAELGEGGLLARLLARRDVADRRHDQPAPLRRDGAEADLGRELAAILAARVQLEAGPHRTSSWTGLERLAMADVRRPEALLIR
jgi:hypothetical protein